MGPFLCRYYRSYYRSWFQLNDGEILFILLIKISAYDMENKCGLIGNLKIWDYLLLYKMVAKQIYMFSAISEICYKMVC